MSVMAGWQLQCANTTCIPFITASVASIRQCQTACLGQITCRAASFHKPTSFCKLFAGISNQMNNMSADMDTVTMMAIAATRTPPEPTTTTTTTTTSTTTTTTTTTSTTTTTTTTTSTTTTTTTTTSTTTSSTTSSTTTGSTPIVAGTQNYAVELNGNGYHGVQKVRYYSATNTGSSWSISFPIAYLSGTTFTSSYVNNAWYALHAGCGNSNGIATCTAVCKALSRNYYAITSTCGTGYSGSVTTYVNPDRAVYTATDDVTAVWNDYGAASSCGNPMYSCDCTL